MRGDVASFGTSVAKGLLLARGKTSAIFWQERGEVLSFGTTVVKCSLL